MMFLKPVL
jgi:hypothetical protein